MDIPPYSTHLAILQGRESNTTVITQTFSNAFPLLNHWEFCCARRLGDQSLDRTRVYDWTCLPTHRNMMLGQNKDYIWIFRTLFIICVLKFN